MRIALLLCLIVFALAPAAAAQELAPNFGMESGRPGQPPEGWSHNAYGELAAATTWDPTVAHSGAASLRLECKVFRGGAAQAFLPVPAVKKGETYTLRAWMRAESVSTPVGLMIRDIPPPYHSYLATSALITTDWRPVVITGQANADGANVGIYVLFGSAGTLWVDDVSLMVGEHPVAEAAVQPAVVKGNLVQNSGFELGMAGWTMPEMVAVEDGGVAGKCAHWLNKSGYMLEGRPITLKPGQQYTFSAFLRSPDPGMRVVMGLQELGGSDHAVREFAAPGAWERAAFSFTAKPTANPRYYITFARARDGSFLVDNVQVAEGDLSDYTPRSSAELALDLPRDQRFPGAGEEFAVGILSPAKASVPATLVASDYTGRELWRRPLDCLPGRSKVRIRADTPGFISLALLDAEGRTVLDEAQVCATRPVNTSLEGDLFFGCHGPEGAAGEHHALTAMAKAGARLWRLHDMPSYTQWFMVQPEKDKWVWYDAEIDAMRARGLRLLGVFCRTPKWAGRNPGGEPVDSMAWPPRDWDEFGEYVFRTVDHYKDKIKHWEAWNEPWGRGFWAGTPEEFAKLQQIVYTQAKRADPDCVIIGGCFWPGAPEFTDRVMAQGAAKSMDAVSYHHYCEPDAVAMGQVKSWYEHMREKMAAAGVPDIPIHMTEGGTACPSYYWWLDRRDQARGAAETVAKHLIQTKSLGVASFSYYYAWQEVGSPRMFHGLVGSWYVHPLLEWDGSPKPTYAAYAGAARMLTDAKPAGSIEQGRLRAYAFQRGQEVVLAVWARDALVEPLVLKVDLGDRVRAYDMMSAGREATREKSACVLSLRSAPTYLVVKGLAAEEILRRVAAL